MRCCFDDHLSHRFTSVSLKAAALQNVYILIARERSSRRVYLQIFHQFHVSRTKVCCERAEGPSSHYTHNTRRSRRLGIPRAAADALRERRAIGNGDTHPRHRERFSQRMRTFCVFDSQCLRSLLVLAPASHEVFRVLVVLSAGA